MGWFDSSEEQIEQKMVDSNGQVNNNIIIQEAKDVHDQLRLNEKVLNVMYTMCGIELLRLGMYIYVKFVRRMKKKYGTNTIGSNNTA